MAYARCGRSGLHLPRLSLGLWWNFGGEAPFETARAMVRRAVDLGITHIDLANNYGPPPGSAEETFGRLLATDLRGHRDELVISTKAGYRMWPGPYGEWGSRKYLLASLDASLRRMGLDTVDIFYSHRFDPETPLEETMGALADAVRSGKALYVGISSYPPDETRRAATLLRDLGIPCLIHQPKYSLLHREPEDGLLDAIGDEGMGCAVFSPLAQGLLAGSATRRPSRPNVDAALAARLDALAAIAARRGQSLTHMALAFVLRDPRVTTAIIGASRPEQIDDCVAALASPPFTADELAAIDGVTPAGG
jgi:L-glyceraldehyde 3-phosphate reductase